MRLLPLALAVLLAGCAVTQEPTPAEPPFPAPGCDRPLVLHHAGGVPADPATLDARGPRDPRDRPDAPAAGPPRGCFHRVGVPSFEPSIGIGSDGAVYYYPAGPLGVPSPVSMARSTDQGASWQIVTPGIGETATHPYSQDPFLYLDPATDRVFAEDLLLVPPTCGMMSITDDGGDSWSHTQSGCGNADHVSIFAGPPATSSPVGYPTLVYRCAISGGAVATASTMVTCQRSLDGGMTWLPPGTSPWVFLPGALQGSVPGACSGGNGHGAVGADGTVYLPRGHCGQPELAISKDEGMTWTTVQVSDKGTVCDASLCEHDAGVGVDPAGKLYYAWVAADRMPYVVRSDDGGATWGEPAMLAPPGVNEAALIQMHVGGTGKLAMAYLATTNGPGAPFADHSQTTWGAYMTVAYGADDQPVFATAVLNETGDPLIRGACGPLRCGAVYDFIDVRIGPDGTPWAPYVDGCFEACDAGDAMSDGSEAVVGRLVVPSLWDEADPNGPYPG